MVNPDSDLYRAHPNWALVPDHQVLVEARNHHRPNTPLGFEALVSFAQLGAGLQMLILNPESAIGLHVSAVD